MLGHTPISSLEAGRRKTDWPREIEGPPDMYVDYDLNEVVVGPDIFPCSGGLVAQYRFSE